MAGQRPDAGGVHQREGVAEVGAGVGVDEVAAEDPRQHEAGRVRPLERLKVLGRDPGEATTEELRQSLVYYRALFEDLLESPEPLRKEARR